MDDVCILTVNGREWDLSCVEGFSKREFRNLCADMFAEFIGGVENHDMCMRIRGNVYLEEESIQNIRKRLGNIESKIKQIHQGKLQNQINKLKNDDWKIELRLDAIERHLNI